MQTHSETSKDFLACYFLSELANGHKTEDLFSRGKDHSIWWQLQDHEATKGKFRVDPFELRMTVASQPDPSVIVQEINRLDTRAQCSIRAI